MTREMNGKEIPGVQALGEAGKRLTDTDNELREMLGEMSKTLTSGDTLAVQEAANLAARLSFHERMQLVRLDKPLVDAGLAFLYTPPDLLRADPNYCDVFWETERVIKFPGDEFAMPIVISTRGVDKEGKLNLGKFDSIYMTEKAYEKKGGKQVVLLGAEDRIPEGEVQGRIVVDKELHTEINEKLTGIKRIPLDEGLIDTGTNDNNTAKVTGYHIYPERDETVPPEKRDKAIEFFYNRGHIALVLELDNGKSRVMTLNAIGDDGRQAGVNKVKFTDGRYGTVDTVRMLVGAGRTYRPELSRGYADVMVAKLTQEIKKKLGLDLSADQLSMELGLDVNKAITTNTSFLRQDWAYENVTPALHEHTFDKDMVMTTAPAHAQHILEEFEGLMPKKATASEILTSVESGDMVDSFSLSVFAQEFLSGGQVVLNQRFAGSYVALERQAMPQIGNKEVLVVPQGPAYEPGLMTVGQIHPNTGDARFWYQARYTTNPGILAPGPKYEKVPVQKVLGMMTNLDFSVVDSATLFRVLLNQKILIPRV
jgi:hypothetical protein